MEGGDLESFGSVRENENLGEKMTYDENVLERRKASPALTGGFTLDLKSKGGRGVPTGQKKRDWAPGRPGRSRRRTSKVGEQP